MRRCGRNVDYVDTHLRFVMENRADLLKKHWNEQNLVAQICPADKSKMTS